MIGTGLGGYLCVPLLRQRWHADMDEGEARQLLEDCMRILFYRDCRGYNRIQIAKASAEGVLISPEYPLDTDWSAAALQAPKAGDDTDGGW